MQASLRTCARQSSGVLPTLVHFLMDPDLCEDLGGVLLHLLSAPSPVRSGPPFPPAPYAAGGCAFQELDDE